MDNTEKLDILLEKALKDIKAKNARQRYDINRQWEKIAMFILNIAFNWNLEDLNLIRINFPGIDLGDSERHIGVQVSTKSSPDKIRDSLYKVKMEEINGEKIFKVYNHIYFFVPGYKQKSYRVTFDTGDDIHFSTEQIIDFDVFRTVFCVLNEEKQEAILAVLNRELCKKPKYQLSAAPMTNCEFIEGSRQKEMEEIDKKFTRSNRVFLCGMGGIGKTELAAEWGMHKDNVYLVHYRNTIMDTILDMVFSGMEYVPAKPGMTDEQKREEEFRQRLDILQEYYSDAVIIIDNFDDGRMSLAEMQNQPDYKALIRLRNKFLFTTRFMVRESAVNVKEMDIEDLLKLVKQNYDLFLGDAGIDSQSEKISQGERDEILRMLIRKVDRHTLTVDLISKTLYESFGRLTPEMLLDAFEKNNIDDLSMPMVRAYHNSSDSDYELKERRMYEHLRILFNLIELGNVHRNVMRHAVLIPLAGMPVSMFRRCHTQEEQEAIEAKIFHRSWLRLDRTHTVISIHPVICEVCRRELEPDDENCKRFLHSLRNSVNVNEDNQELVKPVADTFGNAAAILPDVSGEWNRTAGNYYRLLGMYQRAIDYLKKASVMRMEHQDVILADIYNNIGNAYTNLREFENSIEYHKKSLAVCEDMLLIDHKRIARGNNDLGVAYSYKAEKEKKIDLYEKAIMCFEKAISYNKMEEPVNELHISNALNNIGNTYSNLGKTTHNPSYYEQALSYHKEAKDMRKSISNISSKNLARSYKNIGNDYANLNKNDKALEYRIKALELYKKILHGGHPELANAYQDVGNTCRLTGDYKGAFQYYSDAETIWKKQLPQNYIPLAKCQYAIGMIYWEQASQGIKVQYDKALEYYLKALESYEKDSKSYGKDKARCKGVIAETYLKLGKRKEALPYLKESSDQHANTQKIKYKLVKKYHHFGEECKKEKRFEDALEYYCKVLDIREEYFRQDFENMMETYFQIGCIYRDLRLPKDAMPYLEKALVICEEHFPEDKKKLHRINKTIEITIGELKKLKT